MGASSSTATVIQNSCTNTINQVNNQMVKLITETTVNVSTRVLQEEMASIDSNTTASNALTAINIAVLDGATLTINQINKLKVTVGAILNIVEKSDLVNSLTTQITNNVQSSIQQDQSMQDKINAVAQMEKDKDINGEFNNTVSACSDAVNKILSIGSSNSTSNLIQQAIISTVNQNYYSETDIENYVNNIINTNITQRTVNKCLQSNNSLNTSNLKNIVVSGKGSTFDITQQNIIDNYYSCFVSSSISSSDLQSVATGILDQSKQDASQGSSIVDDFTSSLSNITKTLEKSFLDNIQYIVIAIAICVVIGAVLLFGTPVLLKMLKQNNTSQQVMDNTPIKQESLPPVDISPKLPPKYKPLPKKNNNKLSSNIKNYKMIEIGLVSA